jgi:DNA primase
VDAVAAIKSRLDLVEYIGRSVALQRSGRNFKGNCPFHNEKTPSFYVFPDKGNWRCFGACGEGGDLFSFVQKRDGVDFRVALRELAREAGVELSAESSARRGRAEHLSALVSAAVEHYQRRFKESAAAREYIFGRRGLSEDSAETFRIGWAPDEWRGLRDYLSGRGYSEGDAIAAGLLVEGESGSIYDRFRGRVIIPIADERGQYVGLGGRGLGSEQPKYLNSPQTEIFDKGRTLFGLNLAAQAIRESGTVVVVEGYMDVIGPWQAGFRNVVATMGTSLTEHHVALLRRSARRIVLALDPDAAGYRAAERAGGLLLGLGSPEDAARSARSAETLTAGADIELRVAPLPPGKDPDEVAREDPAGWSAAIDNAAPFAAFLIERLMQAEPGDSPLEARQAIDRVRPVIAAVRDPVERGMYMQRIARHLGVSERAVQERLGTRPLVAAPERSRGEVSPAFARTQETFLLATLLRFPELGRRFGEIIPPQFFTDALDREVFQRWRDDPSPPLDESGSMDTDPIRARWQALEEVRLPPFTVERAAEDILLKIERIKRERDVAQLTAVAERIAELEREAGAETVASVAHNAWRGILAAPEDREMAEINLEVQQLSESMHRHEDQARHGAAR